MAKMSVTLQVWGNNHAKTTSIQGEAGSRIIEATFLDASGAPVNLTDCTPRMVVDNGAQEPPMNDGVIVDATGGVADFTITSDMLTRPGDWSCEFALAGPSFPLLKANGLMLHVDVSNTENGVGSTNQLASLWIALNKADAAAATAQQAATDAQEADQKANDALTAAIQVIKTAGEATQKADGAAAVANQATANAQSLYQMIDPTTGKMDYITNILKNLETYIFSGAITAGEFDALNITAGAFDALNISALDFDTRAKSILGVS